MPYRFKILAARVVDGDTVELTFDTGFHIRYKAICRLAHINAPEGKGTEAAMHLALSLVSPYTDIEVETTKADKYGRYLVELFRKTDGGWVSLNQEMIHLGLAVPYEGGKR